MPQHRPALALSLRLASVFFFAIMFLAVKLTAERGVAVAEMVFWRQAVAVPVLFGWLLAHGELHRLRTQRIGSHALRTVVGISNMPMLFTATALLPLAESTTLGFTAPLFAVVIAAMVLREPVGPWRWSAVLLGFAGVLVIVQPGFGASHVDPLGTTLALFSALMVSIINFQLRDLGRTEEPICTVFWFCLIGSAILALILPFFITPHDATEWLLLLGIGLSGVAAQLALTASVRFAAVSSVIVMDYSGLFWSALLGWLVWHHVPPLATWLGAPLIVAAGVIITWREHRLALDRAKGAIDRDAD